MQKTLIILTFILLLTPGLSLADECDDTCSDLALGDGVCLETDENGFCEGKAGFTYAGFEGCDGFDRCCCTNIESSSNENLSLVESEEISFDISNETSNSTGNITQENRESLLTSLGDTCQKPTYELLFWFLIILVVILGVANYLVPRKEEPVEEDEEF
jgi:hypothetical protein